MGASSPPSRERIEEQWHLYVQGRPPSATQTESGQPAVYKLDSELPDTTHEELTQEQTEEFEQPSSSRTVP
jgi:hypothetical protein